MVGLSCLTVFLVVLFLFQCSEGSRILVLEPFPGPSHFMMFKVIVKELLERGHHVTAISAFQMNESSENYTEIHIDPPYPAQEKVTMDELLSGDFSDLNWFWLGIESSEWGLKDPKVQQFIQQTNLHFDLIITEQFFQDSWLMFAHKFKAPIIAVNTFGPSDLYDRIMGVMTPWSFVPHSVLIHFGDDMVFWQRCFNVLVAMSDVIVRKFWYMPIMEKMAEKYFKNHSNDEKLPSLTELEKSISLILVNSHNSFHRPRPTMPGIINIAGIHLKPIKKLPADIEDFLNGAEHGAIYFSLGSHLQFHRVPEKIRRAVFNVFKTLKQRVIMRWDSDNLTEIPANVLVRKWLPQNDILAHRNVILFISHGGLYGLTEGIAHGIPMLIIPFFADQPRNAIIAESKGFALKINLRDFTENEFKFKISCLIRNETFREKAREMSELLADNPKKPLEDAVYWIEYVIRHKGAKHLKSAAVNLPWYQYLLLDVLAVYSILLFLTLKLLIKFSKKLFKLKNKIKIN